MENRKAIKRHEIIGKLVRSIFHVDLPFDKEQQYQNRLIVVELESGLRFSLQQGAEILDPISGVGFVYPYVESAKMNLVLESSREPNLVSPIQTLVLPYGWKDEFGLVLENGFALHSSFSDGENIAQFYHPDARTKSSLVQFDLAT